MNNPEIREITEGTWTKILTNVTNVSIKRLSSIVNYYATYRLTGDETPITDDEKYRIFEESNNYTDDFIFPIDLYIYCSNSDNDNNDSGKIRIDYIENIGNQNVLSFSKNALLSTTYADNEIIKGNAFQVHRVFTIPSTGKKLVLDLTNVDDNFVLTLPLRVSTNQGQCYIYTYKILNYTGGTIIPISRRNSTIEHNSNGIFKEGVTSTDIAGDDLRQYIVGSLSTNQNKGGGSVSGDNIKIFGKNIIMFEVINKESSNIDLELNFNWYEI